MELPNNCTNGVHPFRRAHLALLLSTALISHACYAAACHRPGGVQLVALEEIKQFVLHLRQVGRIQRLTRSRTVSILDESFASVPVCYSLLFDIVSFDIASLCIASLDIASLCIASLCIASLCIASLCIVSLCIASLCIASLDIASLDIESCDMASLDMSPFSCERAAVPTDKNIVAKAATANFLMTSLQY